MKRLTYEDEQGNWGVVGLEWSDVLPFGRLSGPASDRIFAMARKLKEYEDTGLTPDGINALREIDNLIKTKFNGALNLRELVDGFCKFHDANSDGERVAEAILITNEEVAKWEELQERDTAKVPEEFDGHWFKCPSCGNYAGGIKGNFCHVCGQRLKWEE